MSRLSRPSRIIATAAFFIVSIIVLYLLNQKGILPQILFFIGFIVVFLISVVVLFGGWQEVRVIPIKHKK